MAPLRKIQDHGSLCHKKGGYIRGQEGMRGERKGGEEEESMAKWPRGLGGMDPLTLEKAKERLLPFLSEAH